MDASPDCEPLLQIDLWTMHAVDTMTETSPRKAGHEMHVTVRPVWSLIEAACDLRHIAKHWQRKQRFRSHIRMGFHYIHSTYCSHPHRLLPSSACIALINRGIEQVEDILVADKQLAQEVLYDLKQAEQAKRAAAAAPAHLASSPSTLGEVEALQAVIMKDSGPRPASAPPRTGLRAPFPGQSPGNHCC